jgi:hypothetical protein
MNEEEVSGDWTATNQIEWAIAATICLLLTTPHLIVMGVRLTQHNAPNIGYAIALHLGVAIIGVGSFVSAINQMLINQEPFDQESQSVKSPFKCRNYLSSVAALLVAIPTLSF